ncbi:MAG: DNA repair exonuclease [Candidatus Eisenbacteria bacterium]
MLKLVHTADVHLGAPLGWLGERAAVQREQLKRTLTAVVDLAVAEKADCLVIAGDLFDSQSPPASDVRFAFQECGRFGAETGAAVVILPGSHDHLGPTSVYASYRKEFDRTGGVSVLGLDGRQSVDLERCGLSVRGTPPLSNRSSTHQLAGLRPDPRFSWNVAVAHGSLTTAPVAPDDHPVSPDEIAAGGWSYVALGHWHSWRDVSVGRTKAIYPGAPEVMAVDQSGAGHVAVVELTPEGTNVKKVRVGSRAVLDLDVDVTGLPGMSAVADRVRSQAAPDADTILRLTVSGLAAVDAGLDVETLCDDLAPDYFRVLLGGRHYHVRLEESELEALPERLVVGRFARLMKDRYEAASGDAEREEIEDALQLGVALLQGKSVLG